ncbi:MAG: SDR family NAD(P)-dependent oxidoreductase [Eubacteriales bacterium]
MMKNYTLITGATGGLGKAFAVALAEAGKNLIITDISRDKLETLAGGLARTHGVTVETFACNLMEQSERLALFDYIKKLDAELELTVNVAGLDYEGGVETLSSDKLVRVLRVNSEAALDITRHVASIDHAGAFNIINVASMAGFYPMPLKALYSASKRAIIQFSLAVREEIKEKGGNILALCPAGLMTNSKVIKKIESQGLMGRLTTIDLGKVVLKSINRVKKGRPIFVPGMINVLLNALASLLSETTKARIVYHRWKGANAKL